MAQVSESRPTSSTQPNVQDVFLNSARRDRVAVVLHLMDGRRLDAWQIGQWQGGEFYGVGPATNEGARTPIIPKPAWKAP